MICSAHVLTATINFSKPFSKYFITEIGIGIFKGTYHVGIGVLYFILFYFMLYYFILI
jgi:hypothetical protein